MLKKLFLALAGVAALALVPAFAEDAKVATKEDKKDDKKELKLEGELVCVKCILKEKGVTACANALKVKGDDKKEVIYYLDDKGAKEDYHSACCQEAAKAKLTGGTLTEKEGKKTIKDGKIELVKDKKEEKKEEKKADKADR